MTDLSAPIALLQQMDWHVWLAMFWYMVLLEVPRYTFSFVVVAGSEITGIGRRKGGVAQARQRVSVVIAGHNEAEAMRKCLRSLAEQTRRIDEIIAVDDGSTDGMREVLQELRRDGLIHIALCNQVRCGKAAACNLGMGIASGDIIVNVDADCSYDRDAIAKLLEPFADPRVGAACGNIGVRNAAASVVTSYQAVEYLVSISLGKRVLDMFDLVVCASGAFAAFRREALQQVGANVPGPGEDFDMTMRLRRAGWAIRFVGDSWCMTDVPETLGALVRQRRRWDRDTIRIRLRKFRDVFTSSRGRFNAMETWEQVEFLFLNLIVTLIFPAYIGWLFFVFGADAWILLVAVGLIYTVLDAIAFSLAAIVSRRYDLRAITALLPYVVTYGFFNGYVMRTVRLWAYFEEWVFRTSYRDAYVPQRVLDVADRY
jgi:cellulose synthase/poly-beta-1,6-N-acetylglucosamine synthase-like glycosyltransferase